MDSTEATERITNALRPFMGLLLFIKGDGRDPSSVTNNGTVSFVDTGGSQLLVTCAHVVSGFRKKKTADPSFTMAVSGSTGQGVLTIKEEWLVDCGDDKLDLAVFRLPNPLHIQAIGKTYFRNDSWPPAKPVEGETVAIVGFPGEHRRVVPGGLEANIGAVCVEVSSVSERCFTLMDVAQDRVMVKMNPELDNFGSLAGMSGSAAYSFDSTGSPHLIGFLFEAGEEGGVHVPIRVAHAAFIKVDGTLDRTAIVW
jgi:hypothetical protein